MKPTHFEIMRANRARWVAQPLPAAFARLMEINGTWYREAPERGRDDGEDNCFGCAFDNNDDACNTASYVAREVFGLSCGGRRVIYIKAV